MIDLSVTVTLSGPALTRPDPQADFADLVTAVVGTTAAQALALVHQRLNAKIKHPTPYYETQVIRQRASSTREVVHDRGIVYGPWLEGVSPRNRATGFAGYAAFHSAALQLDGNLDTLLRPDVVAFTALMGG